ncbi:MAG TPA: hypothetical protein ENI85_04340, partial [Deltaproteobacteria bacterium]|nr:hypothetical protein [Deltaproteobacteria bacterium]
MKRGEAGGAGVQRRVLFWCLGIVAFGLVGMPRPGAAQRDFSKVEIETTRLGSGIAMLTGAGGNIGVSTGPDGVLMIDDQYAPLTDRILASVRALSD